MVSMNDINWGGTMTQADVQNLLALIAKAPITGAEAMTVAVLQRKLEMLIHPFQGAPVGTAPGDGEERTAK